MSHSLKTIRGGVIIINDIEKEELRKTKNRVINALHHLTLSGKENKALIVAVANVLQIPHNLNATS